MGIANIGIPGLILIVVLALIIFGPKKLPEIGKAAGDTLKVFKSSVNDVTEDTDEKTDKNNEEIDEETDNK